MDRQNDPGEVLSHCGTPNVYFQPPEGYRLVYPCIVYELKQIDTLYAGNLPYINSNQFRVTVIDKVPMSAITERVLALPTCRFVDKFRNDNLYHDVLTLYY